LVFHGGLPDAWSERGAELMNQADLDLLDGIRSLMSSPNARKIGLMRDHVAIFISEYFLSFLYKSRLDRCSLWMSGRRGVKGNMKSYHQTSFVGDLS